MSTSKNFLMNKGMSYKVTAKARGYYDYSTILNPDGTAITYDMTPYDGLNYNVDLTYNAYRDATIDFSQTKLPYLGLVNQSLQTSEYCLKATGQNYDLKEYNIEYNNIEISGNPIITDGIVSNFSSNNYVKFLRNKFTSNDEIILKFKLNTIKNCAIFHCEYFISVEINETSLICYNWQKSEKETILENVETNKWYWVKVEITDIATRKYSISTDGVTYTEKLTTTDTSAVLTYQSYDYMYIGNSSFSPSNAAMNGYIDLNESVISSGEVVYNLNENTIKPTGETKSYAGIYDPDYTDTGAAKTLNCFSNGNEFVVLSEKENYQNYTYLGTVNIPEHNISWNNNGTGSSGNESTINPSTFKFGDRIDNKATVVGTFESNDGKKYVFAVLDSSYYGKTRYASGLKGIDTGLPNYTTAEEVLVAKESATYNTDYILNKYKDKATEAFTHCKSIEPLNFNGKKYNCQLPNAYELKQIYNNSEKLYELDPTTSTNTSYNLANWIFNGIHIVWSSNEQNSDNAWTLLSVGAGYEYAKNQTFGFIPIIEIPLEHGEAIKQPNSSGSETL